MLQLLCKIYQICHAGPEDRPIGGIKITCIGHVRNPNQSDDSRIIIVRSEDIVQVLTRHEIFKYQAASTDRAGLPNNLATTSFSTFQNKNQRNYWINFDLLDQKSKKLLDQLRSSRPKIKEITGSTSIFQTKN